MLTLLAEQPECLWDDPLPVEVKELRRIWRRWMCDCQITSCVADRRAVAARVSGDRPAGVDRGPADDRDGDLRPVDGAQAAVSVGVPDVGRGGVGLDSSAPVLSDLADRAVPDESTIGKLTRRIGVQTVSELTRALLLKAVREKRFRPQAVRIDSTAIEADVRYPTDAGLASSRVRVLAREGRKLARLIGEKKRRVRHRSHRWAAICERSPARFVAARGRRRQRCRS